MPRLPKKKTEETPPPKSNEEVVIQSSQRAAAGSPHIKTPEDKASPPRPLNQSPTLSFSSSPGDGDADLTFKAKINAELGLPAGLGQGGGPGGPGGHSQNQSFISDESVEVFDVEVQAEAEEIALANVPEELRATVEFCPAHISILLYLLF